MAKPKLRIVGASMTTLALVASLAPMGGVAFAAEPSAAFWTAPTAAVNVDSSLMTSYGVRAGSAGADFVGISNVNYDISTTGAKASENRQIALPESEQLNGYRGAGLAIWGTSVNENANPYYANLLYSGTEGAETTGYSKATTWISNGSGSYTASAWGDTDMYSSKVGNKQDGKECYSGMEYSPDIIFGANKYGNWNNLDSGYALTNFYKIAAADRSYNPVFANNDSTNLWTQTYTINQLAAATTQVSGKTTRYDATASALAYEKSMRGNLLYIASQIDAGTVEKKTVAYLYCIGEDGTAYFFTPEASGLTTNDDTNGNASSTEGAAKDTASNPDKAQYAGNNGTIDLDYMDTLPFITNTYTNDNTTSIVMKVEDIFKANPACTVISSDSEAMKDVDVIIYNTTTAYGDSLIGTSGGKNSSGIKSAYALTKTNVESWAEKHGASDGIQIIAGDDWGTSSNQGYGTVSPTEDGMSPLLYVMRNYTTDKPARAVWAYSQVYSELYPNADASYAYWVDGVYHINTESVAAVTKYMTNQSDDVVYTADTAAYMENLFQIGLDWWNNTGSKDEAWSQFAYYNGSSRASYYDGNEASEEPTNLIGIMAPTQTWLDATPTAETDTTALSEAIDAANAEKFNTKVSADGTDVAKSVKWVTQADADAYAEAIAAVQTILDQKDVAQYVVDAAKTALDTATAAFETAMQDGLGDSAFTRLAGSNAYGTMNQIVSNTWESADTVILATFDGYWDALTASGLAGMSKAPILMTGTDELNTITANLINKLGAKNVIIAGGTSAISADVAKSVEALGVRVTRLAGATAADTAIEIYDAGASWSKTAVVATVDGYWDALAASPLAYAQSDAIFLASDYSAETGTKLNEATLAKLTSGDFDNIIIVGGISAVSGDVETQLTDAGYKGDLTRLAGATAVETSNVIANYCVEKGMTADGFGVATIDGYWDALTGAAMCGVKNTPLILVNKSDATSGVKGFLKTNGSLIAGGTVLGGTSAVPDSVVAAMDDYLGKVDE